MPLTLLRLGMDSLRELATEVGVPYDGADKEGLRERLLAEATRRDWSPMKGARCSARSLRTLYRRLIP